MGKYRLQSNRDGREYFAMKVSSGIIESAGNSRIKIRGVPVIATQSPADQSHKVGSNHWTPVTKVFDKILLRQ